MKINEFKLAINSLGLTRSDLVAILRDRYGLSISQMFDALVELPEIAEEDLAVLSEGLPVAYLIGNVNFLNHKYIVTPDVLIPRPETEELCEYIFKTVDKTKCSRVLDICTGSGVIAISLALNYGCLVDAIDISLEALEIAKENAKLNEAKVNFIQNDLLKDYEVKEPYDIVTFNPPYVLSKEIGDELSYEPLIALDGGPDGMVFYQRFVKEECGIVGKNTHIFIECSPTTAPKIVDIMSEKYKNHSFTIRKDINGKERFVIGLPRL